MGGGFGGYGEGKGVGAEEGFVQGSRFRCQGRRGLSWDRRMERRAEVQRTPGAAARRMPGAAGGGEGV